VRITGSLYPSREHVSTQEARVALRLAATEIRFLSGQERRPVMLLGEYHPTPGRKASGYGRLGAGVTQIRQWHREGCGRANSDAPGTANRIASAKSSPVVKSSALACSSSSREMVIVTLV